MDLQVADEASDLLIMTVWDGELEAAKAARDQLAAVVHVQVGAQRYGTLGWWCCCCYWVAASFDGSASTA